MSPGCLDYGVATIPSCLDLCGQERVCEAIACYKTYQHQRHLVYPTLIGECVGCCAAAAVICRAFGRGLAPLSPPLAPASPAAAAPPFAFAAPLELLLLLLLLPLLLLLLVLAVVGLREGAEVVVRGGGHEALGWCCFTNSSIFLRSPNAFTWLSRQTQRSANSCHATRTHTHRLTRHPPLTSNTDCSSASVTRSSTKPSTR